MWKPLHFLLAITSTIPILYLSYHFFSLFWREPPKIEKSTMDLLEEYYNEKKKRFVKTFETSVDPIQKEDNPNANIQKELYDVEWYSYSYDETNKEECKKRIKSEKEIEESWKRRIMMEYTPMGNVIMYYDPYKHGFSYYSNHTLMDYFSNALAMKYVLMFKCRDFFVDETISPEKSPLIEIMKSGENQKKEKTGKSHRSIYNTGEQANVFIKRKTLDRIKDKKEKENNDSPIEIKTKNKFIRVGKIEDFSFLQKPKKSSVFNTTKTSYSILFDDIPKLSNPEEEEQDEEQTKFSYSAFKKMKPFEKNSGYELTCFEDDEIEYTVLQNKKKETYEP